MADTRETTRTWWCEGCQDGTTPATHLVRRGKARPLTAPGLRPNAVKDDFYCEECANDRLWLAAHTPPAVHVP